MCIRDSWDNFLLLLKDAPDYAPGTQKKVSGEVIRWNNVSGPEKIDAVKYIELLEAEIEELNRQVAKKSGGQNELMEYMKSLEPQNLKVGADENSKICMWMWLWLLLWEVVWEKYMLVVYWMLETSWVYIALKYGDWWCTNWGILFCKIKLVLG